MKGGGATHTPRPLKPAAVKKLLGGKKTVDLCFPDTFLTKTGSWKYDKHRPRITGVFPLFYFESPCKQSGKQMFVKWVKRIIPAGTAAETEKRIMKKQLRGFGPGGRQKVGSPGGVRVSLHAAVFSRLGSVRRQQGASGSPAVRHLHGSLPDKDTGVGREDREVREHQEEGRNMTPHSDWPRRSFHFKSLSFFYDFMALFILFYYKCLTTRCKTNEGKKISQ